MKTLITAFFAICITSSCAAEMQIVPAHPPLSEFKEHAGEAAIVLICKPNAAKNNLEVSTVIKGQEQYETFKDQISEYLVMSDEKALATNGFRAVIFINFHDDQHSIRTVNTIAWWPQRDDVLANGQKIRFLTHTKEDVESIAHGQNKKPNKSEIATPRKPSD